MASPSVEPTATSQCGRRQAVGVSKTISVLLRVFRKEGATLRPNEIARLAPGSAGRCRRADIPRCQTAPRATAIGVEYDTGTCAEAIMTNDLLESVKDGVA